MINVKNPNLRFLCFHAYPCPARACPKQALSLPAHCSASHVHTSHAEVPEYAPALTVAMCRTFPFKQTLLDGCRQVIFVLLQDPAD